MPKLPLALLVAALATASTAAAQHAVHAPDSAGWQAAWGAQAVPLLTHAAPAVRGESRTEVYLTQPALWARASSPGARLRATGMLNLEGLTLRRGELNAGVYGEGYVDRRHPHTFLHELMATATLAGTPGAALEATLSLGKGFAPFGTDDPMVRPFVKFPVNHHLAQVLERAVGIVAVRAGPVVAEAGLFNGDEPAGPGSLASLDRFGDSWAARLTVLPGAGVELQGSFADLASPELPAGSRVDHRKWSASARWQGAVPYARAGLRYALVEWARMEERAGAHAPAHFHSLLAEAAAGAGGVRASLRLERTVRPEEERLGDPFRSAHPHTDLHLLGSTRWDVVALALAPDAGSEGAARALPFLELSHARATDISGSPVWEPADWYGAASLWSVSAGVRVGLGPAHPRMGRYGAALTGPAH